MGLWKDKTRGDWRYSFEHQKKTYAGGGFKTKGEARSARETRRKEVKEKPQAPEERIDTDSSFSVIAAQYLDWSLKRHAKKTYEYKRTVYREFLKACGDPPIDSITPHALHSYLNTRPSVHNYNVHRKELCALFSFAVRNLQIIDHSPCWNLEKLPEEPARKAVPTEEEFVRIMLAANSEQRTLLIILKNTLARIDEILRLRWEDVNFEGRYVALWTRKRKGGNLEARYIPMNDELHGVLSSMWKRREQNNFVFWNTNRNNPGIEPGRYVRRPKMMASICRRAGVPHYGFHAIRHFVATYLHDKEKISTAVIGTLLGHKSKRTTEIYLHPVDESARIAVGKLDALSEKNMLAADACGFGGKGQQKNGKDRQ
jgi:integrase